eukprot:403376061
MGQKVSICSSQNLKSTQVGRNQSHFDDNLNNQYSSDDDENNTIKGSNFKKGSAPKPLPNPNRKFGQNGSSNLDSQGSIHTNTQGSQGSSTHKPATPTITQDAKPKRQMMGGRIGGAKKLTKSFIKEYKEDSNTKNDKNLKKKGTIVGGTNSSQVDAQSMFKTTDSINNESQDYGQAIRNLLPPCGDYQKHIDSLRNQKAMKIRITWNYGGKEVYIIGSFTSWEYIIKMHKNQLGITPVFEISMYVKEGQYYYYFIVDGKVRFAPDQPSTVDRNQRIVNYMEIDKYMIARAENEREHKVKSMIDCLATENSWCLSQNFERDCKERCQLQIEDDINFSIDMVTHSDDEKKNACGACESSISHNQSQQASKVTSPRINFIHNDYFETEENQKENSNPQQLTQRNQRAKTDKKGLTTQRNQPNKSATIVDFNNYNPNASRAPTPSQDLSQADSQIDFHAIMGYGEKKCAQKFIKFCPSSSYMEKESLQEISQLSDVYN